MLPERRTRSCTTMQDFEPARAGRLSDDNMGGVGGLRVFDDVVGDPPVATRDGVGIAAQRLREAQRIGDTISLLLGELEAPSAFDRQRDE